MALNVVSNAGGINNLSIPSNIPLINGLSLICSYTFALLFRIVVGTFADFKYVCLA